MYCLTRRTGWWVGVLTCMGHMGLQQEGEREICVARFKCIAIPPWNYVDSIFAWQDVEGNGTKHDSNVACKFQSFFSHGKVKWESNNACLSLHALSRRNGAQLRGGTSMQWQSVRRSFDERGEHRKTLGSLCKKDCFLCSSLRFASSWCTCGRCGSALNVETVDMTLDGMHRMPCKRTHKERASALLVGVRCPFLVAFDMERAITMVRDERR